MNLQQIKEHTERLNRAVNTCIDAQDRMKSIASMEYYDIFDMQAEKEKDYNQAADEYELSLKVLKGEFNIGKMLSDNF